MIGTQRRAALALTDGETPVTLNSSLRMDSEPPAARRRWFVQNFGCQMNDYDVERMREVLAERGFDATASADDADLIVINTCSVREKAESKVASAAGRYRELKARRPEVLVAIGGCVAQQEGERLLKRIPVADFTFGPDQIPSLGALVERRASGGRFAATEVIEVEDYRFLSAAPRPAGVPVTALVTIQKGCDNHCAFCVVPATRGREVSRPWQEVVDEVGRFVAAGAREVTLIGQNVNSYHGIGMPKDQSGTDDFAELLARVDRVPGLLRLRYTTSHPHDFTDKVADAFRELSTLCAWLHLPVQSGSSRTLKRMVRDYTREQYLRQIDYVKSVCPDISLSTDIIVGYPGETDSDFAETLSLLEIVEYDSIYSFEYSERPDTPALKLALRDNVLPQVKAERLQAVQSLQKGITARRLSRWVGREVEVLVEGDSARYPGQLCGRTTGNEMVNFAGPPSLTGKLVPVRITAARGHTLTGEHAQAGHRLPLVSA
jgi:tRNA-2-methylthio-N6-dimethylallyladenosine synthase